MQVNACMSSAGIYLHVNGGHPGISAARKSW